MRTHDLICLFASRMENRLRDLKWKFFDGKFFKIFKIKIQCLAAQNIQKIKVWLHFSRSCTDAPLNTSVLLSELLSFHLFIFFWMFFPNLEVISNLCTGRPSRPITTIEGFTTARLSSAKARIRYLIIGKRQIVSIKAVHNVGFKCENLNWVMPSAKLKTNSKIDIVQGFILCEGV